MYFIYILTVKNNNFYTGYSADLKKRLQEHQSGRVFSTKDKLPVKLVYYEACLNKYDALKREKYLKSGPGKKFIKKRLEKFLEDISSNEPRAR